MSQDDWTKIAEQLLSMEATDMAVRERLVAEGVLYDGYHPDMEAVHKKNSATLDTIVEDYGWPSMITVGEDAARAACRIALNAISTPDLMRKWLPLMQAAAEADDLDFRYVALIEDCIAFHERRPQRYGTIFDWDENGKMSPWTLEDPPNVDERRLEIGLPPLVQQIEDCRLSAEREKAKAPEDIEAWLEKAQAWRDSVGW